MCVLEHAIHDHQSKCCNAQLSDEKLRPSSFFTVTQWESPLCVSTPALGLLPWSTIKKLSTTCVLGSSEHACVAGEARSHRGGAHAGRVKNHKAARSGGGSRSVRAPPHTTIGADRRWPQRNTIVHSALALGRFPSSLGNRPSSSWSPLFGGGQSAALPDWSFCGAQRLGKTATWCPQVVFCPQAHAGHW